MNILAYIPDDLRRQLLDNIVAFLVRQADRIAGDKIAKTISQLSSQAAFHNAFDEAMKIAMARFVEQYTLRDEDLVVAITNDERFWHAQTVRQALLVLVSHPGSRRVLEQETVTQHFTDVLPHRINRERVDKAIAFLLGCISEELWTLPGAKEIREVYSLQFLRVGAAAAQQQVLLQQAQLQALTQLSTEVRLALLQLTTALEQQVLASPSLPPTKKTLRPYHNLSQPDYSRFVGRQGELEWLRLHLSPEDRTWQMVITGIGGVGKSALALTIAYTYLEHYQELAPEERFEAIIWISAKTEVLTITGSEQSTPPGLVFQTLGDIYTTIAQTLEREDITRALPEERDHLVRKALSTQRVLLLVDNLESVSDNQVRWFLYHLPAPTKCIITSREWVDVAAVLKLTGLPADEARHLIIEETKARGKYLNEQEQDLLFKHTSGIPLPIKLSIARLASGETFEQVLRWLGNAVGDLPDYCIKGQIEQARQRNAHAWELLLSCSLFDQENGADRETLGTITGLSFSDRDEGLVLLQRLSLLNTHKNGRFWMLPMVRSYAEAELARTDLHAVFTERLLQWLVAFTHRYGLTMEFHLENTHLLEPEYPNLLQAIRWCREHERWEMLLQLAEGTWFYPYLIGLFSELHEILEAAVQATRALHMEQLEGRFTRRLGLPLWIQGQFNDTLLQYLNHAEEIASRYQDDVELGQISTIRCDFLAHMGRTREAEQRAISALKIGRQLDHLELKIWSSYQLALFEARKQHFEKALQWLDRGDNWCRELGWSRKLAWNSYLRSTILIQQGKPSEAEPLLIESLHLAASWGERRLMACSKHDLARIYQETQPQRALQMVEEAHDLYERLGMEAEIAQTNALLQVLSH